MKGKLLFACYFIMVNSVFSQSQKILKGVVMCEKNPVPKVDVANYNSKQVITTNTLGTFSVQVKVGDELVFISKNYEIKRLMVDQKTMNLNNLIISLQLKPEQLNEVVITNIPSIKLSADTKWEEGKIEEMTLIKNATSLKNPAVYDGRIENGVDLIKIGSKIMALFKKEKDPIKKEIPKIEFATLARKTCDEKFYIQTLHLKPEEINLFLQFCEADPKSQTLSKETSVLNIMDFLIYKNSDFKKL